MKVKYNGEEIDLEEVNWDEEKAYDTFTKEEDLEDTIELSKDDIDIGDNNG